MNAITDGKRSRILKSSAEGNFIIYFFRNFFLWQASSPMKEESFYCARRTRWQAGI
jgi:hypothetical protein